MINPRFSRVSELYSLCSLIEIEAPPHIRQPEREHSSDVRGGAGCCLGWGVHFSLHEANAHNRQWAVTFVEVHGRGPKLMLLVLYHDVPKKALD
jgi:hypothetical protein